MKRKTFGDLLIVLGMLLLAAALALVGQNFAAQEQAESSSREVLMQLEIPEPTTAQNTADQSEMPVKPELSDYRLNPRMPMPETEIDGIAYIGTLEIPALGLELPIISSTTNAYLKIAPCRYQGSAYEDNLIIGAHNYDAHFGRLKTLSYGDEIIVTDLDGNVFSYLVADMEILQPNQTADLVGGGWPLTLYTCTVGGKTRVVIRCEKQQ